jgi:sugar lactone lactonase YvrE
MASAVPLIGSAPHNRNLPESYVYTKVWSDFEYPIPAPLPYRYAGSVYAQDIGVESFMHINEINYHDGRFFITNGNTLIVTNNDFTEAEILTGVELEGVWQTFTPLNGIFITPQGDIYVAEPAAERVLHFNAGLEPVRVLGRPENIPIRENAVFRPMKVAVDLHGRIYIIAESIFDGMVELNPDGTFNRYFGVVEARPTTAELFWRTLQSPQQRIRSRLFLPVNFTNLTVDGEGFVYATMSDAGTTVGANKLNARGVNVMRRPHSDHFVGDMSFNRFGFNVPFGPSIISIIEVTDFGVYYVFDNNRNRVFAYDQDGYMLFAFGGSGSREGMTGSVNGMTMASGGRLAFTDQTNRSIEIFERTEYGNLLMSAAERQYRNDYAGAAAYWEEVLRFNPFFQYAYLGVGIALYRQGYFEEAMIYFRYGQNPEFYSMAYHRVRSDNMMRHFNTVMTAVLLLLAVYVIYKACKRVSGARKQRGEIL